MEQATDISQLAAQLNDTQALLADLWTVIAASLVLFMQAGFCFVEAGSVRTKNNINVAVKNIIDMCATCASYFIVGYSVMFGASASGILGTPDFFLRNLPEGDMLGFLPNDVLRHSGNHRFRRHRRTLPFSALPAHFAGYRCTDLPRIRPLGMGRRLVKRMGLP